MVYAAVFSSVLLSSVAGNPNGGTGLTLLVETASFMHPATPADLTRLDADGVPRARPSPQEAFEMHLSILRQVDALSPFARVDIFDHINADHPNRTELALFGMSGLRRANFKVIEHDFSAGEHTFNLTCRHRGHMAARLRQYDWFMYLEDDVRIYDETVRTHINLFEPMLAKHNVLPAWSRVVRGPNGQLFFSDLRKPQPRSSLRYLAGFGVVHMVQEGSTSYAASWLYPRSFMIDRFVGSKDWNSCCYCTNSSESAQSGASSCGDVDLLRERAGYGMRSQQHVIPLELTDNVGNVPLDEGPTRYVPRLRVLHEGMSNKFYASGSVLVAGYKIKGFNELPVTSFLANTQYAQRPANDKVVVALDKGAQVEFVDELLKVCAFGACAVHVMSKNASCKQYANISVTCDEITENVGRDAGSALEYVLRHYDELPSKLVFVPTSVKHHRLSRAKYLIESSDDRFHCASWQLPRELKDTFERAEQSGTPLHSWRTPGWNKVEWGKSWFKPFTHTPCRDSNGKAIIEKSLDPNSTVTATYGSCQDFSIADWDGERLAPATPSTFGAWVDAHVGKFSRLASLKTCYNVIFKTSRERLLARPTESYADLLEQVSVADANQGVHFVERAAESIFGGGRDAAGSESLLSVREKPADEERVGVLMWYDEGSKAYGDIAAETNKAVSEAAGFTFVKSDKVQFPERHPSWQKVGFMLEELNSGRHDAVLWVDADAALTVDAGKRLREILSSNRSSDIIFGANWPFNAAINMGVALFRNTIRTRRFLRALADGSVPEEERGLEVNYTLMDHPAWVEKAGNKITDRALAFRAKSKTEGDVTIGVYHNIKDLCDAHAQLRQWEQSCVQGLLQMKAFEGLQFGPDSRLQTMPVKIWYNEDATNYTTWCPTEKSLLSRFQNVITHFAACNETQRQVGLESMRQLACEHPDVQCGLKHVTPSASRSKRMSLLRSRQAQPPRKWARGLNALVAVNDASTAGTDICADGQCGFPDAIILGCGKCGTNALGEVLKKKFNWTDASSTAYSKFSETSRQGWVGEINWPCDKWTGEGLAQYRRHFWSVGSTPATRWFDKSTALLRCDPEKVMSGLPPRVKLLGMLCDPVEAVWSRMNHDRSFAGVNASGPELLQRTVEARLGDRHGFCKDFVERHPNTSFPLCLQIDDSLRYARDVREWKRVAGDRVRFLITEESESDPEYLTRHVAEHIGAPLPLQGARSHEEQRVALATGTIHSHFEEASYIAPRGPAWDRYVSTVLPTLMPVMEALRDIPGWQTRNDGHGDGIARWWPWLGGSHQTGLGGAA